MKAHVLKKMIFTTAIVTPILLYAAISHKSRGMQEVAVLNATLSGRSQPVPLYGFNGNNTRGPAWTDKAYRDSAASLDFSAFRYPGGGVGEFWDWKKGWYVDVDANNQRAGIALPESMKKMSFSPGGLKELQMLVGPMHSEVVFDVNMLTRDIDDQIEMLKAARELGIEVKWVELGNEFNLKKSPGRLKYTSAEQYGATAREWVARIKQEFPGVKVAVIGGNESFAADVSDWNEEVLRKASNADAIVAHLYPVASKVVDNDGINFEKVYSDFKREFDRQGFENVRKDIWVTEYNIHWAIVPQGDEGKALQKYASSWGQALAAILMTSEATKLPESAPDVVLEHSIGNWNGFAALEVRNGEVHVLPNGIGMRAWFSASRGKSSMQQITFKKARGGAMDDYEVLGWQFKSGEETTNLLVNLTSEPVSVTTEGLETNGKTFYTVKHADKNKIITKWEDISRDRRELRGNTVYLPPYSIATL